MTKFKYTELSEWIKNKIINGEYKEGAQIPTEAQLSEMFSISRDTVRQGLLKLEKEGLLYRIKGSGTYVKEQDKLEISTEKSMRIGVIMNDIDNYIFPSIIKGINTVLANHGYTTSILFTSNKISQEEQLLKAMIDDSVDGLIVEPTKSALPSLNKNLYEIISQTIPTISIHGSIPYLPISSVTIGDEEGSFELTKYLIGKGHKKIAILCKFDEQTGTNRYLGYVKCLQAHNIPIIDSYIHWFISEDTSDLFTTYICHKFFTAIEDCSAIICHDDRIAVQLISYLNSKNIQVPKDVSVVGFDNSNVAIGMSLTTIDHPKEVFGKLVAEKLLEKIANPILDVSYNFQPKLVERDSVLDINKI